jgi:4-carboxymuconolactone decarboxylase
MKSSKMAITLLLAIAAGVLLGRNTAAAAGSKSADAPAARVPADIDPESKNRLPLPRREDMNDEEKKIFDEMMGGRSDRRAERGRDKPPIRLHSPRLAKPMADAHRYLKNETGLGERLTAVAVLTTARELDNQFEWTQWEEHGWNSAESKPVEREIIDTIKYCKPVKGLGEKESAIIKLGREMFGVKKVSSPTFAEVLRLFGKRGTVDLVELMAMYSATGAEVVAFDMQLHEGQKPLLPARASVPACRAR